MREIQLGKRLVKERHKADISQEKLAKYMGVSKAAVSKWENDQSYPDITLLPLLATYFNISIDELLGYEPQLTKEDLKKAEEIMERSNQVIDAFQIDHLHPNVMASYYITCAQIYAAHGCEDKTLEELNKYVNLCTAKFFPFELHGDDFFDKMDSWFQEFELGTRAPRGKQLIKESMVSTMCDNPCFQNVKDGKKAADGINLTVEDGDIFINGHLTGYAVS